MHASYTTSTPERICQCIDLAQSTGVIKYNPFIDPEYVRLYSQYLRQIFLMPRFVYSNVQPTPSHFDNTVVFHGLLVITWAIALIYLVKSQRKWCSIIAFFFFSSTSVLLIAIAGGWLIRIADNKDTKISIHVQDTSQKWLFIASSITISGQMEDIVALIVNGLSHQLFGW